MLFFVQKSSISEQNQDFGSTVGYQKHNMDSRCTCIWGRPPSVPVTEHEYAIMKMSKMMSYWTFFHENLSEFTSGVFLATVKVGSIYVDFSSYNYETQMMMISKFLHIDHIWSKIESKVSISVVL